MGDEWQKDFREHEKDFSGFKAVSEERHKNLKSDMDEIKDLLKSRIEKSDAHENAQALIITDLNNRVMALEIEKKTIKDQNEKTDKKYQLWIAIGVLLATLLAGPAAKLFDIIAGG